MEKETEEKILKLKDKFYNCEIDSNEYRTQLKRIFKGSSIKILPSRMALITFPLDEKTITIDDWDGIKINVKSN